MELWRHLHLIQFVVASLVPCSGTWRMFGKVEEPRRSSAVKEAVTDKMSAAEARRHYVRQLRIPTRHTDKPKRLRFFHPTVSTTTRATTRFKRPVRDDMVYQLRTKTTGSDNECWVTVEKTTQRTKPGPTTTLTVIQQLERELDELRDYHNRIQAQLRAYFNKLWYFLRGVRMALADLQRRFDAEVLRQKMEEEERRRTRDTTECYHKSRHFVATSLFWTVSLPFIIGMMGLFILSLILCKIRC